MTIKLTLPQAYGLKFVEWSRFAAEQMVQYGVTAATNEDSWKAWVGTLFYVPELVANNIPEPGQYDNWQAWADVFVDSVR